MTGQIQNKWLQNMPANDNDDEDYFEPCPECGEYLIDPGFCDECGWPYFIDGE